jgi:ParB/RepB/Spo0J family partition protein
MENVRVPLSNVKVDKTLNPRVTYDEKTAKKLVDSIKENGLLHPPTLLRNKDGSYLLVAGFRRFNALQTLKQDESDFRVLKEGTTLESALGANIDENLTRDSISSFEVAKQCHLLANRFKMSPKEIAACIHGNNNDDTEKKISPEHVSNLISCYDKMHPIILTAWSEKHAKASLTNLFRLKGEYKNDKPGMLKAWKTITGEIAPEREDGDDGETKKAKGGKGNKRPTADSCRGMIAAIEASDHSVDYKEGAKIALTWAAGDRKTVPGTKDVDKDKD